MWQHSAKLQISGAVYTKHAVIYQISLKVKLQTDNTILDVAKDKL